MLAEDAVLTMPPIPTWYRGRDVVAGFLAGRPLAEGRRWRVVPTRANGQPALGYFQWDGEKGTFIAHGINVLTLDGARIAEITAFLTPETFARFGLPDRIQP